MLFSLSIIFDFKIPPCPHRVEICFKNGEVKNVFLILFISNRRLKKKLWFMFDQILVVTNVPRSIPRSSNQVLKNRQDLKSPIWRRSVLSGVLPYIYISLPLDLSDDLKYDLKLPLCFENFEKWKTHQIWQKKLEKAFWEGDRLRPMAARSWQVGGRSERRARGIFFGFQAPSAFEPDMCDIRTLW